MPTKPFRLMALVAHNITNPCVSGEFGTQPCRKPPIIFFETASWPWGSASFLESFRPFSLFDGLLDVRQPDSDVGGLVVIQVLFNERTQHGFH